MLNIAKLKKDHANFLKLHYGAIEQSLDDAAAAGRDAIMNDQGFTRRTGKAQGGAKIKVIRRGGKRIVIRFSNRVKYAPFLEHGTRPHRITARNAKALRFWGFGQVIYRKTVMHPGTRAYSFMKRARHRGAAEFGRVIGPRLKRAAASF